MCTHPIDHVNIHLLGCVYGNQCTGTHDAVCDTFVGFHMGQEQLYALSTTFNSSHWQVNIIFIRNGIFTLVDVVIANPMWAYLLPQSYVIQRFVASNATQAKEKSYHD
jgi:hypothetical protein